jgi:hypothetical protein
VTARDGIRVGNTVGTRVFREELKFHQIRVSQYTNGAAAVSYELVFGPSSSLQRRVAQLQANGSCDIGRQATSEDTQRRLGKCYSGL